MMDMDTVNAFAADRALWVVEDAAHALPAAYRSGKDDHWRLCGENTADVTCYSFYANKTITTGEGGMAVTHSRELANRMRQMSLHGLSHDAWKRYSGGAQWDYRIVAPGYKYNMTDVAAAIGIHQLQRAEALRLERERIAQFYIDALGDLEELELPVQPTNRIHSWHLFPVRLQLEQIDLSRNVFVERLREQGVGCSVHWRPLHLHPYYQETFGWEPDDLPVATREWERLVSLPLFPGMTDEEQQYVVQVVRSLAAGDLARSKRPTGARKPR
jgi:perosamine synthetase